ncbi:unnamed protein product [Spodoptera exigua]|nr:unnamed protein product [Spodoptera exigua]
MIPTARGGVKLLLEDEVYIKNKTAATLIRSGKNKVLLASGHLYNRKHNARDRNWGWYCTRYHHGCKARIITDEDLFIIAYTGEHDHDPPGEIIKTGKGEMLYAGGFTFNRKQCSRNKKWRWYCTRYHHGLQWFKKPTGKEVAVLQGYTFYLDGRAKSSDMYLCTFGSKKLPVFSMTKGGNPVIMIGTYRYNRTNGCNGAKVRWYCNRPEQLRHELNIISGQLPRDLSSPIDSFNLAEVYNLLQIRTRMSPKYLIIEIKIPLIGRDMYEIYRLIPIPYLKAVQLTGSGLLSVNAGCIIKSEDFLVFAHRSGTSKIMISSEIEAPRIAPINHIINVSIPTSVQLDSTTHSDKQLQEIRAQIDIMKDNTPIIQTVSTHDAHHYAAIYIIIGVMLLTAIIYVMKRVRVRRQQTLQQAAAEASQEQSLPVATTAAAGLQTVSYKVDNQCSKCASVVQCSEKAGARIIKQNSSTSPILCSVFTLSEP